MLFRKQVIVGTLGHGRLLDPPGRNTMWRLGFDNPVNYNDDEVGEERWVHELVHPHTALGALVASVAAPNTVHTPAVW